MIYCQDCKFCNLYYSTCTFDKSKITLADVEFNRSGAIIGCNKGIIEKN